MLFLFSQLFVDCVKQYERALCEYLTYVGTEKQTAVISEFYSRFRFWLNFRHCRAMLHWPTKFHPNRITHGGVMTSYQFSRWRPWNWKSTSGFRFSHGTRL